MPTKEDLTLNVQVQARTDAAKKVRDTIQSEGGFSGKKGSVALNKVNNLISMLENSKGMDEFIKNLKEVQKELVNSAKYVKNLSKDMVAALNRMTIAQQEYDKKVENLKAARENRKIEYQKVAANENIGKYTYKSSKTGREVTSIDTITGLHKTGDLEIYNAQNKKISGQIADNIYNKNFGGIDKANESVTKAEEEIENAKIEIAKAEIDLNTTDNTNAGQSQALKDVKDFAEGNDIIYNKDLKDTNESLDTNIKSLDKQSSSLGKAFKQFSIYAIAVRSAKKAINEAKKTIIDLDKYLTEQAMVTGKTRKETYALLNNYQDLAKQLGSTTKEIADVATQYMRQGKSTQEALKLTEAAVSAAKVAGISATESVNYLTTALNGFQLSAQDAMAVSDKFAAVAAQSATSYEEIAIALSKVASQANLAGMSIDYTTALLAKGIETTREAPETIGTALKTVIARMRELTDYGETLEGDTDINNVESQLAYVGIQLKNTNGDLRSTEEVLDELGRKWKDLSVNQQAAIAKALAGTRQQSRLIAMMSDYERTIELQEIAQRSAGATNAQMETYIEGMDAAIKRLDTAWEQIVTNITDSDVIISLIDRITGFLDKVANFLSTDFGIIATMTIVGTIALATLGTKLQELKISKQIKKISTQQAASEKKLQIEKQKSLITTKETELVQLRTLKTTLEQKKAEGNLTAEEQARLLTIDEEISTKEFEISQEKSVLSIQEDQLKQLESQDSLVGSLTYGLTGLLVPLYSIIVAWKTISGLITIIRTKQAAAHKKTMGEMAKENAMNATNSAGKIIGQLGIWGIPIAIGVAAALAGIALGIKAINSAKENNDTDKKIDKLSASIYNLEKTKASLDSIASSFDVIDQKVIKTKADIEAMNEELSKASDSMSTDNIKDIVSEDLQESQGWSDKKANRILNRAIRRKNKGKSLGKKEQAAYDAYQAQSQAYNGYDSEQEYYNSLTHEAQRKYIDEKTKALEEELKAKREKLGKEVNNKINGLTGDARIKALNEESINILNLVTSNLYNEIDNLSKNATEADKERLKATEGITSELLQQLDVEKQLEYYNNPEKLKKLIDSINKININGLSATEVLDSDDYSLVKKTKAYKEVWKNLTEEEQKAFEKVYPQFAKFSELIDQNKEEVLIFIEELGISNDKINDLKKNLSNQGLGEDAWIGFLETLEQSRDSMTGMINVEKVIYENFEGITKGTEEWAKALNVVDQLLGHSVLEIGQAGTKTKNQINSIYETAQKWNTMSASEQAEFLSENAELFKNNEDLYEAFKTGDFAAIEKALINNERLNKDIQTQLKDINNQISIEEQKNLEDRDEALLAYLYDQKQILEDQKNFYKASLDLRLEQEQKQLDIYKNYLSKQQEALTDSLNKRKDAYQKYFDAINQEEEDEEYEEEANKLISNISKLSSSNSAASKQTAKELENQLKDLEEERLKTLRERAQEGIISNIDDEVEEINDKFDKLLENNQNLLAAMLTDENNKDSFMANIVSSSVAGMTANEAGKWFRDDFMTTFGSAFDKDAIEEVEEAVTQYITNLNVNGTNATLTADQQKDLFKIIMEALTAIGYN